VAGKGNNKSASPPWRKPKEDFIMSKLQSAQKPKIVLTRLKPEMSREEKIRNLKAALVASGFNIVDDKLRTNNRD
jgi:hypothetical protein